MKFLITRDGFADLVQDAARVVASRATLPVLSNLLMEARDGTLTLRGTDLDNTVVATADADVKEEGAVTVPAGRLKQLVRELEDAPVRVSGQGASVRIRCASADFRLHGLPADEFPDGPSVDFEGGWTVSGPGLVAMIDRTTFAASSEDSRPVLNGVLWEVADGETAMVATDGHRLARASREAIEEGGEEASLIVPADALAQVSRLMKDAESVRVARSDNHLGFEADGRAVFTRLIEGPYPNYRQVIPSGQDKHAVVDRGALESVVRRMSVVASDQTHRVRIGFGPSKATFRVQTPDLGEATDELALSYEGDEGIEIAFNGRYLADILKRMPDGDLRISMLASERAVTIEPVEGGAGEQLALLMPLRLTD